MKYFRHILFGTCILALLAGCSSNEAGASTSGSAGADTNISDSADAGTSKEPLHDLLPEKMTELSSGGKVPEEYRVTDPVPACVDPISLMGTWCVEGSSAEAPLAATDTRIPAAFQSGTPSILELTCLPDTLVFGLGDTGYMADSIAMASINGGFYLSNLTYRNQDGSAFYGILPYTVSGKTLAAGFYDSDGEDGAQKAQEIDYLMDWTGWKLTLTYEEESVTYVPYVTIRDEESGHVTQGGSIIAGYEAIDGITAVYPRAGESTIAYGDEVLKASYDFRENGSVSIEVEDGRAYELTFRYSGDTLTLIDRQHVALYAD